MSVPVVGYLTGIGHQSQVIMGYDIGWKKKIISGLPGIVTASDNKRRATKALCIYPSPPQTAPLYCKFSPSCFHCSIYLGGRCTCVPQQAPQLIKAFAKKKKKKSMRGAASGASSSRLHRVMTLHWESEQRRGCLADWLLGIRACGDWK